MCVCVCVCARVRVCAHAGMHTHTQLLQSCLTLCNPMDCSPLGSSVHGDFPGKNTGVGWHALLWGIFLTQGSNPCLLPLQHCRQILPLLAPGKPLNTPKVIHSTLLESEETPCGTFKEILGRGRVDVGRRLNCVCVCVCVCMCLYVCCCCCCCCFCSYDRAKNF